MHEKTYKYDDQGQRAIKRGPQGETVYVNQFFTDRPGSNGTKHVYAGTSRIASKLMRQDAPNSNPHGNTPFEKDLYFYHPDHLGSSNFITDLNGKLYEHLEYFPFGESWVEENSNVQRTPYLFTAKELDEETGLYYFGARYYDPRTTVWQSPDPILGKYLTFGKPGTENEMRGMGGVFHSGNLGLYSYAHLNPLKNADPDGRAPEAADGKGAFQRMMLGVAVHNKAIKPYFEQRGWQSMTTYDASGENRVFGGLLPDAHRETGRNFGVVAEGKPLSNRDDPAYSRAKGEVTTYRAAAKAQGFNYRPASNAEIFEGKTSIDLGVIEGYLGEVVRVTLYPDLKNPNSGVFFYGTEEIKKDNINRTLENLGDAAKRLLENGPFLPPGGGGRRDPDPVRD